MYETPEELDHLQVVLDESAAAATKHHRFVFDEEKRLTARELADRMAGMRLLHLATVTSQGEPRVAPVDGLFFHGHFWFGSDHESIRFQHIRKRPAVSAAHTIGEDLAVLVHGTAELVDVKSPELEAFGDYCRLIYGEDWNNFGRNAQYARILPKRMYVRATS